MGRITIKDIGVKAPILIFLIIKDYLNFKNFEFGGIKKKKQQSEKKHSSEYYIEIRKAEAVIYASTIEKKTK